MTTPEPSASRQLLPYRIAALVLLIACAALAVALVQALTPAPKPLGASDALPGAGAPVKRAAPTGHSPHRQVVLDTMFKEHGEPLCEGCNIVVVSIDTLRPDRMSAYGYPQETTPRVRSWFGDAGRMERAYSSAPCTVPSVKQFMTSSYHGGFPTMAEAFGEQGYATAAIVSQHHLRIGRGTARGFHHYDIQGLWERDAHSLSTRRAETIVNKAIHWLEQDGQRAERFFLWLHHFDPHDPYHPPAPFRDGLTASSLVPDGDRRAVQMKRWEAAPASERPEAWYLMDAIFSDADRAALLERYDAEIRYTDQQLGRLFDALERLQLTERTIVVLLSDHGERLGEDGAWDHCYTLADVEIRVPLLWKIPGVTLPASTRALPASTLDVFPTLLHLIGDASGRKRLAGRSLLDPPDERVVVASWRDEMLAAMGSWKLLYTHGDQGWTTDRLLRVAPDGATSEAPLADHAEVVRAIEAGMDAIPSLDVDLHSINEETLDQLRQLGYTQ